MASMLLIILALMGVGYILLQTGTFGDALHVAADLVKGFEGFSATAYPDPPGQNLYFSIGYGHRITGADGLNSGSVVTQEQAGVLLATDLQTAQQCIHGLVTVPLTIPQEAALISFTYNVGCGAFGTSTMLKLINQGNYVDATNEFGKWIFAGGVRNSALESRRQQEQDVFAGGTETVA